MKNILIFVFSLSAACAFAQVAIGKTSVSNSSVSLEFYDSSDNVRAIVLPWVTSASNVAGAVEGTIIFDASDKKVKYKNGTFSWADLTRVDNGVVDTSLQDSITEKSEAKAMIGGTPSTDTTPGILVLGDTNKAMVLPKIASPHLTIIKPEPGTMAFDTVTQQLAVYNGTVWSFWKP